MRLFPFISAVDSNSEAGPARGAVGEIPVIPINAFKQYWYTVKQSLDELRSLMIFTSRGIKILSDSMVFALCAPEACSDLVYLEGSNFLPISIQ